MSTMKRIILTVVAGLNVAILLLLLLTMGGSAAAPITFASMTSPQGAVEGFFQCLAARDFAGADAYISNYKSLGLANETVSGADADDSSLSQYIYQNVFDSYAILPTDDHWAGVSGADVIWRNQIILTDEYYNIDGTDATVDMYFTCLDSAKLTDRLSVITRELGEKKSNAGIAVDTDEAARALFDESVAQLSAEPAESYYSTVRLTVELSYSRGQWRIVMTNELYNALMGKLPVQADAATVSEGGTANE